MLTGTVALIGTFVLDQLSKLVVIEELGPGASRDVVTLIPGILRLIFVRNTGSAFGMFQGSSEFLKIAAILAIILLGVFYARAARHDWLLSLALGLQLGGALGNVVDRFRFGYVVDWIDVPYWPTFNIADSAITVGVIVLAWTLLFRGDRVQEPTAMARDYEPRKSSRAAGEEA